MSDLMTKNIFKLVDGRWVLKRNIPWYGSTTGSIRADIPFVIKGEQYVFVIRYCTTQSQLRKLISSFKKQLNAISEAYDATLEPSDLEICIKNRPW